jgi:hypothetical protein
MMVRPHEVRLLAEPDATPAENRMEGEIRDLVFMGDHTVVTAYLPDEGAIWTVSHRTALIPNLERGAPVTLVWPVECTHVLSHP